MKISLLQHDIIWGHPGENIRHLDSMTDQAPEADVYVLTEMFSTGFQTDADGTADDGLSLEWMKRKARQKDAAIAGSLAVRDGAACYNRLYFVTPDGDAHTYDKRHLFSYGGEDRTYTAGKQPLTVTFRGVRIRLGICYDLRFPVWCRQPDKADERYDLLLFVANWPASRAAVWHTLLKARAIENQCYVAGANRIGEDPACRYSGGSVIISPYGKEMAAGEQDRESVVSADIDLASLAAFRRKFPVLDDADPFIIKT